MGNTRSKVAVPIVVGVVVVCIGIVCCVAVIGAYFGDKWLSNLVYGQPSEGPTQPVDVPAVEPSADTSGLPEWTVIVYSAADDDVLEENMWFDVNEMELVGSNSQMNIVVQMDRYDRGFTGDGDWSDTRRYLIQQDNDLNHIASPVVQSIGEADMGDPQTLEDFVTWAIQNYPAKKYALIMSDHGGGWRRTVYIPGMPLAPNEQGLPINMSAVDGGYFRAVGMQLLRGRTFGRQDRKGSPRVAILSHSLWQRRFGGQANAIGQSLRISGMAKVKFQNKGDDKVAKYAGLVMALAVLTYVNLVAALVASRMAFDAYGKTDMAAIGLFVAGIVLAYAVGGFSNYFLRRPFVSDAVFALLITITVAAYVIFEFTSQMRSSNEPGSVDWRLVPAALLILFALWILAAAALACSTRFDMIPTLAICSALFLLGIMSDYLFGRRAEPVWRHDMTEEVGSTRWTESQRSLLESEGVEIKPMAAGI